jgi:hypothetical protein
MNSFFVGNKTKPSFLVEVMPSKKIITIYRPDKYSKNEAFYEKYSLGEVLVRTKFTNIIFSKKPVSYKNASFFVPEIGVKIKNKMFVISKTITEKDMK